MPKIAPAIRLRHRRTNGSARLSVRPPSSRHPWLLLAFGLGVAAMMTTINKFQR